VRWRTDTRGEGGGLMGRQGPRPRRHVSTVPDAEGRGPPQPFLGKKSDRVVCVEGRFCFRMVDIWILDAILSVFVLP
jgi:hypothetical protein